MKLKENIQSVVVHTPTEEEAKKLLAILSENGYAWAYGDVIGEHNLWPVYKKDTCYNLTGVKSLHYSSRQYYKKNGYTIISLSEFISKYADPDASLDQIISDSAAMLKEMEDELEEKPAEEPLDLCELLQGHEGEKFFNTSFGDVRLEELDATRGQIEINNDDCGSWWLTADGRFTENAPQSLFPSRELYEKYPLDAAAAWREWQEEQEKYSISISYQKIIGAVHGCGGQTISNLTETQCDKCIEEIKAIIEKYVTK